jgi:hypothetical protein
MSALWIAFACGLFLGGAGGVIVLGLCVVARTADDRIEEMFSGVVPDERPKNALPPHLPR